MGRRERDAAPTSSPVPTRCPVERDVWAAFAEARWQPAARLSFTGGHGRRASRARRWPAIRSAFSPRPPFDDDTVVAVNPKVTAAWSIVPEGGASGTSTRLHAAAGTGIRPPDAFEIAFTDNSGLKPERSNSVEAGVTQTFASGAVHADATWFHNSYDDLIVSVGRFSSSSRYTTDNIANARARGAELALTVRPASRLTARATYTFLDSEILAVDGDRRPGAVAVRRRRPAAAPAAASGQRRRGLGHVAGAGVRHGVDARRRRSTWSRTSARSAASSRTRATPW